MTKNDSIFDVKITTNTTRLTIQLPGLYNIYNALAALAVAKQLKLDQKTTFEAIHNSTAAFGRAEKLNYHDKTIEMMLIKNPTGFNQIIQTFLQPKPQDTPVLFAINDKIADGRDVSWLWDAALEDIQDYKGVIICSGSRCYDMALRLKYAGIKDFVVESDMTKALRLIIDKSNSTSIYILPTYTAMLQLHGIITNNTNLNQVNTPNKEGEIQ